MSQNLQTLLATAAELRAVGRSWDSIAGQVHRKAATCRQWPRRHKAEWDFVYRAARLRRFEETSNEAHGHLHNLLRSKDERIKIKAIEVWLKCGAGIYQKLGSAADWQDHLLDEDAGRRDCHRREQAWARYRKRLDAVRAERGQAPLTNDEFWSECRRLRERDGHRPRGETVGPVVAGMAIVLVALVAGWLMSRDATVGVPASAGTAAQVRLKPGLQPDALLAQTTLPANLLRPALPHACYADGSEYSHAGSTDFRNPPLGKSPNSRHHGTVAFRPHSSAPMRLFLTASVSWLTFTLAAPGQVKVPKPPDAYEATIRYRIQADRNERVLQYEEMTKFFGRLGFKETENDDSDLGPFDPTAEVIAGTIPSKTARELLNDRRVNTLILAPAGYKPADDPQARTRVLVELSPSRDQLALANQTEIALGKLGFKKDLGFDTRRFTVLRGTVPSGNIPKLLRDLRYQPSGWFAPEQAAELFAKLPDGTPTPHLLKPFADVLPIRVVEVFGPAEAAPAVVALPPIPADQPFLNKWTADLRRRLEEGGAATKPLRLEVVLANMPPEADLEWRVSLTAAGAVIEGRVGTVVTVLVAQGSKAADLAALSDVSSVRLPRASAGTPVKPADPKKDEPKEEKKEKQARYEAEPTLPTPAKETDPLKVTGLDRLHAMGKKGQGIRVVVVDTDFAGWEKHLPPPGKGSPGSVAFIDLTAERNRDVRPDPMPGTLGHGTQCALAVRLAAPAADLFLVRVPSDAPYQIVNVARTVRGEEFRTDGLITRRQEIEAESNDITGRRRTAQLEYQRAFDDFSDDDKAQQRRVAAQVALRKLNTEEATLLSRQIRIEELEHSFARIAGAQVVLSELQWNTGFALDAASAVSQYLDNWLTRPKGAYTRHTSRPNKGEPPLWFQPAGDTRGQAWTGLFRDVDHNGVMEFAPADAELKPGRWSRELNFLAAEVDGKAVLDLSAGAKVRLSVQWREPHDPSMPELDYRGPIAPLRLQLVKQRDPSGEKYGSDEIDLIAESEGLPARLQIEPSYGIYEHSLEVTLPADGRYAVRIEGRLPDSIRPFGTPTLAGQEVQWELRSRLFVESADGRGRFKLADYSSAAGGVAVPADARSVLAVGAAGPDGKIRPFTATGVGPETELHDKPDLIAPDTFGDATAAHGSDIAAAFAAGWAATLQSAGLKPASFNLLRIPPGGMIVVPADWFRK